MTTTFFTGVGTERVAGKPIWYAGVLFKSRLEAFWAAALDALGIAWDYERTGFEVGRRSYLPDFHLPGLGVYAEVKPPDPTPGEFFLGRRVCEETRSPFLFLIGRPGPTACAAYLPQPEGVWPPVRYVAPFSLLELAHAR